MTPFSKPVIAAVLAFVAASGSWGGYTVVKNYQTYGIDFEKRIHSVERVVDGDTFIIEGDIRIRLLGIDAPESGVCFGAEAKKQLEKLILGKEILLEKDQTGKDSFNRLLRYVLIRNENPEQDDDLVNSIMVRDGFAKSLYIKPNRRYLAQLQADEREAQALGSGLWDKCPTTKNTNLEREVASDPFSNECVIKGNINKRYEKDYFLPGCPNYKRVKVDPRKGEEWFCSEKDAESAGWQKSAACNNIWQTKN